VNHTRGQKLGQRPLQKGLAPILLTTPSSLAKFVIHSEPHTGARPSVRLCVGPELARCVHLPFSSATSPLSRKDLIQARAVYEPTYSPDAGVTCNDFSCRVFQHQLQINETLSSTVTALMESAFPQGATIYRPLPVRPKLLTTGRMSTRSLNLSALQPKFLVGNITEKSIRCCVWSHSRRSLYAHTRALFSVLLPTNVLSSCELSKNCFGA
jgi:hypothetical protein